MTSRELVDLITARTTNLQDHSDSKMTAMQAHIHGKLLSIESDVLDLRADILRL